MNKNYCLQLTNESAGLELLQTDIQQTQQTIARMQKELEEKQKKADMIERSIDEKTSLLKVSEFIQTEQDQSELLVLIDQMRLGETQFGNKFRMSFQCGRAKRILNEIIYINLHHSFHKKSRTMKIMKMWRVCIFRFLLCYQL